jgi:hypothetical protein
VGKRGSKAVTMPNETKPFADPLYDQQVALEALSHSMTLLADAFGVDKKTLQEVGRDGIETAVLALLEDKAA